MIKIIAYCRVSTKKQFLENQEHTILKYCHENKLFVDEWIKLDLSSRAKESERKITYLLDKLKEDDILIVSEISRLGRSTGQIITFIEKLISMGIRLIVIKQNIDISKKTSNMTSRIMITIFSMMAEIERDLISERTIMALERARDEGKVLGRPPGRLGKSKLDGHEDKISDLLAHKVSMRAVGRIMGCTDTCLRSFLRSRNVVK